MTDLLDSLFEKYEERATELPSLADREQYSFDPLQWLWQQFRRLFRLEELPSLSEGQIQMLFGIIKALILVALLLLLLTVVWRLYLKSLEKSEQGAHGELRLRGKRNLLGEQRDRALQMGNYRLALRLEWRIFLNSLGLPSSLTPRKHPQLRDREQLAGLYKGMFRDEQTAKALIGTLTPQERKDS